VLPGDLIPEIRASVERIGSLVDSRFGDPAAPLLVSVRSGARASMPGMMDTILNLGLNDEIAEGLAKRTNNARFALDAYRRFIVTYADVVLEIPRDRFEAPLENARKKAAARLGVDASRLNASELACRVPDSELDEASLRALIREQKE